MNLLGVFEARVMKKVVFLLTFVLIFNINISALAIGNYDTYVNIPAIQSETAVLMVAETGQVLYQKDMDKRMYPASITKIMTGMLALIHGELTDIITISEDALSSVDTGSSNIALFSGEQITLEQALYALSVASANDAANVIAESIGGTISHFVEMMNLEAKEASAKNTHFTNPSGMPDDNHYTTAYDMALITAQALKAPQFTKIFSEKRYSIPPTNKQSETRIFNTSNRLLNGDMPYEGLLMSKVGWTTDSQHTLVTAARRNNTTLIAVVMKSSDSTVKWADTEALLDYGFEQFEPVTVTNRNILLAVPDDMVLPGDKTKKINPDSYTAQDAPVLLPKGKSADDIQFSIGDPQLDVNNQVKIPICMRLSTTDTPDEPIEIYDTTVRASIQPTNVEIDSNSDDLEKAATKVGVFKTILITFALIIALMTLILVFLVIRRSIIVRKRRRRRQASRRRT